MGQLIEWPEVVTEGKDLEECRESLRDAVEQMVFAYKDQGKTIPIENALFESFPVETRNSNFGSLLTCKIRITSNPLS